MYICVNNDNVSEGRHIVNLFNLLYGFLWLVLWIYGSLGSQGKRVKMTVNWGGSKGLKSLNRNWGDFGDFLGPFRQGQKVSLLTPDITLAGALR